jgi:hypothetical protein
MKTQVIQLDVHDDVTSVRDKMSWAKTERILLVFPPRSSILHRILDLHLLQRHASTLGAQLAIISHSKKICHLARQLHLPIYATTALAQSQEWERVITPLKTHRPIHPDLRQMRSEASLPEARWRSLFGLRFLFFTLAVLAILAVLSVFIPSASIKLIPAPHLQALSFPVIASLKVTAVNLAGSLPARLTSVVIEENKTVQASGTVSIPDKQAQGFVLFRNLTNTLVGIPAGMIASTQSNPPVRFATTVDAVLAEGVDKTVQVPVQAVEGGSNGNLPTGSLVAIEGNLGASLAVNNPEPTEGGSERTAAIPTAADRSQIHAALMDEILEECSSSLPQTLAPGDIFFPDTLVVSQVLSETFFPAEGQSGEVLSLTIRLQCQAQYASQVDIYTLARISLDSNQPDGFIPVSGGLVILPGSLPLTDAAGTTRWDIQVQRVLQARLDPLTIVKLSLGRKPGDAIQLLNESLPLAEPPSIQLEPNWWPWLPVIPLRIDISTGI